jgi:hypothetical protein
MLVEKRRHTPQSRPRRPSFAPLGMTYSLFVRNGSATPWDVIVYQEPRPMEPPGRLRAWLSQRILPGKTARFHWHLADPFGDPPDPGAVVFDPEPTYRVAFGGAPRDGIFAPLARNSTQIFYETNTCTMYATLEPNLTWSVSSRPTS